MTYDNMYSIIQIFFIVIIIMIALSFMYMILGVIKNHCSPRITTKAKLLDKRQQNAMVHQSTMRVSTSYFMTFEVEDGKRIELQVPGKFFGYYIVGDMGNLTYQGTRFIDFDRC